MPETCSSPRLFAVALFRTAVSSDDRVRLREVREDDRVDPGHATVDELLGHVLQTGARLDVTGDRVERRVRLGHARVVGDRGDGRAGGHARQVDAVGVRRQRPGAEHVRGDTAGTGERDELLLQPQRRDEIAARGVRGGQVELRLARDVARLDRPLERHLLRVTGQPLRRLRVHPRLRRAAEQVREHAVLPVLTVGQRLVADLDRRRLRVVETLVGVERAALELEHLPRLRFPLLRRREVRPRGVVARLRLGERGFEAVDVGVVAGILDRCSRRLESDVRLDLLLAELDQAHVHGDS
jgi:hypothetical protein